VHAVEAGDDEEGGAEQRRPPGIAVDVQAPVDQPFGKMINGTLLTALAISKAALVAMYFMHLKFETRTLGLIALTPLAIATLLVFVILPDAFHVDHKTANVKPAESAPAKH
jgi:caa(3)-type oxidase subunit IV